ncbi:MAG: hypothetical protein A2W35_09170 [Chloroflexi bacterium RBG_16_57_11]|nr:MAG: hypothetical protein A2W35_09170 [Chloroflexi bacterium RBG_16_57_11]
MIPRLSYCPILVFAFVLAACSPVSSGLPTLSVAPSSVEITPVVSTAVSGSASVGTVEPFIVTQPPLDYTPPPTEVPPTLTPIPAIAGGLGPTELKYRILAQFPDLFFCDPDYYPVARMDELELAKQRFPELQANAEEFNAILEHNNLKGVTSFTDEQVLRIYQEHKKLAAVQFTLDQASYRFQLQSAKGEGNGELISGMIDGQGAITVQQREPIIATCPICLAQGTLIDTPTGPIPVESLYPGMQVWTLDRRGLRTATTLLKVGKTVVPTNHQVVHLMLEDGRQLRISPGHPTVQGRLIGTLRLGDLLDGSRIVAVESNTYTGYATYDLLPAGDTGFYWADGILIASTLNR